jgi:hypothetical protein
VVLACLLAIPWFFYRKMYAWGAVVATMPTALELLFGKGGSAGNLAFFTFYAMMAKSLYVHHASRQLKRLRETCTNEAELLERAKRRGGVSVLSALIGTALTIGGLLLTDWLFE